MNSAQRIIKYLAIAFGVFIIGVILSTLIGVGVLVGRIFDYSERVDEDWSEVTSIGEMDEYEDFKEIKLELKATSLRIERGEKFEILADNTEVMVRRNGEVLQIVEDQDWFDWFDTGGQLKIRLPEGIVLRAFSLDAGAGKVEIDGLRVEKLDLELGAGRVELQNVIATTKAKIDGGAGYLSLSEAELRDLDLDMGAGKVEVEAELLGKTDIDAGVGHLVLNLYGREEDYQVSIDKGLGTVKFNGSEMSDDSTQGTGRNEIKIDGGVGAIDITTRDR